jgi:hypothetical protein
VQFLSLSLAWSLAYSLTYSLAWPLSLLPHCSFYAPPPSDRIPDRIPDRITDRFPDCFHAITLRKNIHFGEIFTSEPGCRVKNQAIITQ